MHHLYRKQTITHFLDNHIVQGDNNAEMLKSVLNSIISSTTQVYKILESCCSNELIGFTGANNITGDRIRKLDIIADDIITNEFASNEMIAAIVGEESREILTFDTHQNTAKCVVLYDPLDGSMNSDVNLTTGSIFSVMPLIKEDSNIESSFKQIGDNQLAAVYTIYGVALKLVFTIGNGVHEFTFNRSDGEFYLSKSYIKIPEKGWQYSCNEANSERWTANYREYLSYLKNPDSTQKYLSRYLATVVADVHRILYNGGIYIYPKDNLNKTGKIRLGYEANPLAFIVEQAGGKAITDTGRILEEPFSSIHKRIPFYVGSSENINEFCGIVFGGK